MRKILILAIIGIALLVIVLFMLFRGGYIETSGKNHPPVAAFEIKTWTIKYNKPVEFDASGSSDPDGDALAFRWDFGDGEKGEGTTVSHLYKSVGTFTVVLNVSDGKGGFDQAYRQITINHIPRAAIKIKDPDGKSVSTGYTDIVLTFDASASTDDANDITKYEWDFGDGQKASGVAVQHQYKDLGVYKIVLTVEDSIGNKDFKSQSLTINYRAIYSGNITIAYVLGKDFAMTVNDQTGSISATLLFNSSIAEVQPPPPPVPPPSPAGGVSLTLSVLDPNGNVVAKAESESDPTIISLFGSDWKICRIIVPYKIINASGYGEWIVRIKPDPNIKSYANVPYILTTILTPAKGGILTMNYEGYVTTADSNPVLNTTMDFAVPVVSGTYSISAMLMFDSGVVGGVPMGYLINDLDLYLFDNNGTVVAHSNISKTEFPPANLTNITVTLQFEFISYRAATYEGLAPGEWKVGISLKQGVRVQYWLTITVAYSTR